MDCPQISKTLRAILLELRKFQMMPPPPPTPNRQFHQDLNQLLGSIGTKEVQCLILYPLTNLVIPPNLILAMSLTVMMIPDQYGTSCEFLKESQGGQVV